MNPIPRSTTVSTSITSGNARDQAIKSSEQVRLKREARLVDSVQPSNAESEKAHHLVEVHTSAAAYGDGGWRAGESLQWDLKTLASTPLILDMTYWGDDTGTRTFDIFVNGQKIATQSLDHNRPGQLFDVEYPLPLALTDAANHVVTVRFQAHEGNIAGGVFGCAILKPAT